MKKILILSLLNLFVFSTRGQDTLTAELLRPHTYIFGLSQGKITGEGAVVWKEIIRTSNFVLLGEKHQSSQLGQLTTALLPQLASSGFQYFAIEVGPNAAEKLEKLASPSASTHNQLKAFTKEYANKTFFKMPINFFHGQEDAVFLQKASELKFDLWGLDQELYYSVEFLLDDLLDHKKGTSDYKKFKKLHAKAIRRYKWLNLKDDLSKKFQRNCTLLQDPAINHFFSAFPTSDLFAQDIIKALQKSWEIYCDNEQRNFKKANYTRAEYMKERFNANYQVAEKREGQPKVFMKMGDLHLSSGTTSLGVDDIGSYVFDLAEKRDLTATNIRHIRRFYKRKNKLIDYPNSGIDWVKYWRPFVELGLRHQWVLIDLRPFRDPLKQGLLKMAEWTAEDIRQYDFILISPEDTRVKPIWKK